ncbi:MAG: tRNA (adenosine(37)-N6)-threonylcarbamoyltransferase complex ATPase subunit type 1 TsaE [bacterium]
MHINSHSLLETGGFAGQFLDLIEKSHAQKMTEGGGGTAAKSAGAYVVGLYGDLGSGKTAFTQLIAKLLGIEEGITSPTYVIEKVYPINSLQTAFKHLIHIDAYRLEKSAELAHLGWSEIISDPTNLVLIEWPERVADIMPADHIRLKFTFIDDTTREIEMLASSDGNK